MNPEKAPEVKKDFKDMTPNERQLRRYELGAKLNEVGDRITQDLMEYQAIEDELDVLSDWVSNE